MSTTARLQTIFAQDYARSSRIGPPNKPAYINDVRRAAWQAFQKQGLPTRKLEAYRYTPVARLASYLTAPVQAATSPGAIANPYDALAGHHIVWHNGVLLPPYGASPLPKGLVVLPFTTAYATYGPMIARYFARLALAEKDAFVALNTALFAQATFLYLPAHVHLDKPLILHHHTTGPRLLQGVYPRLLLVMGAHSKADVVLTSDACSDTQLFINQVAEIVLEQKAVLHYYSLQTAAAPVCQMQHTSVHQAAGSTLQHYGVTLADGMVRNHVQCSLAGEKSKAGLYGLYGGKGKGYIENHTVVDHRIPHTQSKELYKGMAAQAATGVFSGHILVRAHAQKTAATQHHHGWLRSPKAAIYAQPQLAINADDVQCSHGVTLAQLDPAHLFYLRARGISQQAADHILSRAFLQEVVDKIPLQALRQYLYQAVADYLQGLPLN